MQGWEKAMCGFAGFKIRLARALHNIFRKLFCRCPGTANISALLVQFTPIIGCLYRAKVAISQGFSPLA